MPLSPKVRKGKQNKKNKCLCRIIHVRIHQTPDNMCSFDFTGKFTNRKPRIHVGGKKIDLLPPETPRDNVLDMYRGYFLIWGNQYSKGRRSR